MWFWSIFSVEIVLFCLQSTEIILDSSHGPEMKYIQGIHKENDASTYQKTFALISKQKVR